MKRRTVDVPVEHLDAMTEAQESDAVPVTTRMRAMVQVWATDAAVRARVDAVAAQIWQATRAQQQAPLDAANRNRRKDPDTT